MTCEVKPESCLRCGSDLPLTAVPHNELFFYTARMSVRESEYKVDVNQPPRGRLCEWCTVSFIGWLKNYDPLNGAPPNISSTKGS